MQAVIGQPGWEYNMSEVTLKFKLPEENSEYIAATKGRALFCVLWDLDQWLRGLIKHTDCTNIAPQQIRDTLYRYMSENGINFDDID
jgi:hypothetical protein